MEANAAGRRNGPGPASSRTGRIRGARLAGAWRMANEAAGAARDRLEPTAAGRVWTRLNDVGLINSSLQFAVVFTLGFIPFLTVLSAVLGPSRSRAVFTGSGLSAKAGQDFTVLFTNGRTAPASLSLLALVLAVLGGGAVSHMLQGWYAKIFRAEIRGWKAMARRVEWLAGFFGFVALQLVIVRRIQPPGGHLGVDGAQFLLALAFWWWSLHCLLAGQISWRRLFAAGLATAVCYTGLGFYLSYVASSSVVASEASYGPIGAVMTLIAAEIGLGVALQVGAVAGAAIGRGRMPGTGPGDVITGRGEADRILKDVDLARARQGPRRLCSLGSAVRRSVALMELPRTWVQRSCQRRGTYEHGEERGSRT